MKTTNPIRFASFDSIAKGEKRLQKSTNTWWHNKVMLIILTILFSGLDGVTLYPVFESIFAESPLLLYVTTFGTALCLNFIPVIAARLFLKYKYGQGERTLIPFYISLCLFVSLYAAICALRIATRDAVIGSLSDSVFSSAGADMTSNSIPGSLPMIIVQCVTNLATSVTAFFLAYFSENPILMQINKLRLQIIDLEERRISLLCAKKELGRYDFDSILRHEEEKFRDALIALNARRDLLKVQSDIQLEMLCHDPDDTTYITEAGQAEYAENHTPNENIHTKYRKSTQPIVNNIKVS